MKEKIISIVIMLVLIFFAFEILSESQTILQSVDFSFNVWKNNIFPSLFPFFILSEFLINFGFVEFSSEIFKPIMNKLFKADSACSFIFIMSMISGFPSGAKYTKQLYLKKIIDEKSAGKILAFTHFSNPLFILGTISISFLNNKEVGLLILICHYITNVIIGLIFRNYHPTKEIKNTFSFKKAIDDMHNKRISNNKSFGEIITNSLINSIDTLLLILGTITIFLVITTVINNNFNLNNYYQSLINGFFEMSQGLKSVSLLDIPLKVKSVISIIIISFGGLSVHIQVLSIISDTKIKYLPFFTGRILHALISGLLLFILFDFWISLF